MIRETPTRPYMPVNQITSGKSRVFPVDRSLEDAAEQIKNEVYEVLTAGLRELERGLTGKVRNLNMRNLNVGLTILPGENSNYELILEAGGMKICKRLRIECSLPDAYSALTKSTREQRNNYYLRINARNVCSTKSSAGTNPDRTYAHT